VLLRLTLIAPPVEFQVFDNTGVAALRTDA
jgi:hypothetical protein